MKGKYIVFLFAATAFNIILVVISFGILLLLYTTLLFPHIPENSNLLGLPLLFLISLVISFFVYQKALKLFLKKHPLNQ
jgi:hypothetical protein